MIVSCQQRLPGVQVEILNPSHLPLFALGMCYVANFEYATFYFIIIGAVLKEMGALAASSGDMWNTHAKPRKRSRGKGELGNLLERCLTQHTKDMTLFRHLLQTGMPYSYMHICAYLY